MSTKFYRCRHCGNVIVKKVDSGVSVVCCGEKMGELLPQTLDAGTEKHLPVAERINECTLKVVVGSVEHPMLPEHYIQFIYLETERGGQTVFLAPSDKPETKFCCCKDKPVAVYEYCNVHGLWMTQLE